MWLYSCSDTGDDDADAPPKRVLMYLYTSHFLSAWVRAYSFHRLNFFNSMVLMVAKTFFVCLI